MNIAGENGDAAVEPTLSHFDGPRPHHRISRTWSLQEDSSTEIDYGSEKAAGEPSRHD